MHHAFIIEAEREVGIVQALTWVTEELGVSPNANPDVITLRYGLLSVEDARHVSTLVSQAPVVGVHKVLIMSAERIYHEAQNALLKVFEEPPAGAHLFLILPTLGALLPTLRSRVQVLGGSAVSAVGVSTVTQEFLKGSREKRSALIKRLSSGKDEDERREYREEAIGILNGAEQVLCAQGVEKHADILREISVLRPHLYDRSAPVKMILEHLSLVLPKGLPAGGQV